MSVIEVGTVGGERIQMDPRLVCGHELFPPEREPWRLFV